MSVPCRFAFLPMLVAGIILPGQPGHGQTITHQISLSGGNTWCPDSQITGLLAQINAVRSSNGLPALAMDPVGMKDAEMRAVQFSVYMATHTPGSPGFFPHEGYDTTAASLGYNLVTENLAFVIADFNSVVSAWQQDSLHLSALLSSAANVAGVSCIYANGGVPYWTYEPGTAGSQTPSPTPTPTPTPSPTPTPTPTPSPSGTPTLDSEEWAFLTLINNFRAQNGAGPLQVSTMLENSSRWMSNDMAAKNYFSHTDSLGRSTGARLAAFGYTYSPWGENLAAGYPDAQSAFNGLASACDPDAAGNCTYAHKKNMLNPGFVAIGIARASGGSYGWYWTTDFGGYLDQPVTPPAPGPGTAPAIGSFTASPATITAGQSTTLAWSVSGAATVTLDNGIGVVTSLTSKSVSPATTTTYRLTATNSYGTVTSVVTVTVNPVTPPASDTQPPTAPNITSAAAKSTGEVDLVWTASTDNVAVAGYRVLRNGTVIASLASGTLSYADTGVAANTSYSYVVRAYDAAGNYRDSTARAVVTPAPPVSSTCPTPAAEAFTACYYNTLDLSGYPALVRTDPQINFDWWSGSPDRSVSRGNFSVRWQGSFTLAQGDYTFAVTASDGARLYIDGNRVLDQWHDQPATIFTLRQTLSQGSHLIVVEYYERTGTATAHVSWQLNAAPAGQAPQISTFTAAPSTITAGQQSTLSWSASGANAVTIDNGVGNVAAAASTTVAPVQTTTYKLTATNAAGSATATVTLTVNPPVVRDTQPPTAPNLVSASAKSSAEVDLLWTASTDNTGVAGYHIQRNGSVIASVPATVLSYADSGVTASSAYSYVVIAYDAAGNSMPGNAVSAVTPAASVPIAAGCPAPATGAFTACYYNVTDLTGYPALIRTDPQINFDWWAGAPDRSVSRNNFSARWQGYFTFAQATYTFTATISDGIRLYIDGVLILDKWQDQPVSSYSVQKSLTQGTHLIRVEYYTRTGTPTAHISWN